MTLLPGIDVYGEVNSTPLETYGWRTFGTGYDELLNCPALRGENLVLPGAKGRRPYPRVGDETPVSIPLLVNGATNPDGTPYDKPLSGLLANRDLLRASIGVLASGDGTVTFTFHRDDLDPWSGPVTVLGFYDWVTMGGTEAMTRLDLLIPDGELEVVGS